MEIGDVAIHSDVYVIVLKSLQNLKSNCVLNWNTFIWMHIVHNAHLVNAYHLVYYDFNMEMPFYLHYTTSKMCLCFSATFPILKFTCRKIFIALCRLNMENFRNRLAYFVAPMNSYSCKWKWPNQQKPNLSPSPNYLF